MKLSAGSPCFYYPVSEIVNPGLCEYFVSVVFVVASHSLPSAGCFLALIVYLIFNFVINLSLVSAFQEKADRTWLEKHAESMELELDDDESEEERVDNVRQRKATSAQLNKLQEVCHYYSEEKFS